MENRNGLIVDFEVCEASGTAERRTAIAMVEKTPSAASNRPSDE